MRLSPPPTMSTTTAITATTDLSERFAVSPSLSSTPDRSSGRESWTNTSTAAVMSPSTSPIARWIGCISAQKAPNGSSVIPDRLVSSTTENAPSCRVITQPSIEAAMMRALSALLPSPNDLPFIIGRQIRK